MVGSKVSQGHYPPGPRDKMYAALSCDERLPAAEAAGRSVALPSSPATTEDLKAAATVAVLAAKAKAVPTSPQQKRKRKRRVSESDVQVEALRPPRLSPEPEDDPEAAKRVREKNRLRMYRYTRNLQKQKEKEDDTLKSSSGADRSSPEPDQKLKKRPLPLDVTVKALSGKQPKPSPDASGASAEDHIGTSPTGHESGMKKEAPRLSPQPEDASPEEIKRIKAKNRLRMYRWSMAQGLRQRQKPIKKRISSAGSDVSMGEDLHDALDGDVSRLQSNAVFAGIDPAAFSAMVAAANSQMGHSSQPLPDGPALHHRLPRHSDPGVSFGPTQTTGKVKPPPAPPRMSPEPEDPAEAKKVRSKNRVRLHRYNQTVAANNQDQVDVDAGGSQGAALPTSMSPPQTNVMLPNSSLSLAGLSSTVGAVDTLRQMLSGNMGGFRPVQGNLQATQEANRKEIDISEAFCTSIQAPAFTQLAPEMRELAMDTYVKETMGMANSLQALELQLTASQASGSNADPRASSLHAAVSQLRSDIWGLGQMRLAQYSGRSHHH